MKMVINTDEKMQKDLNKMKIIMIIISVISFLLYLSLVNITGNFELQSMSEGVSPSSSIIGWLFVGCIFGMIYYAYLCLISMIVRKIY